MHFYYAYGLGIRSDLELPEFIRADGHSDISVHCEAAGDVALEVARAQRRAVLPSLYYHRVTPQEVVFHHHDLGALHVRGGREVIVEMLPEADIRAAQLFICGTVMAILRYQLGSVVLHASAVALADEAVLFLGHSGRGKSSTAGALNRRGYVLTNDDVTPLRVDRQKVVASPGFPQLKINPDVTSWLGKCAETLPRLHPHIQKRAWRDPAGFPLQDVAVRHIYLLDEGAELRIDPVPRSKALLELLGLSYKRGLLDKAVDSSHYLRECAAIAETAPMSRLVRTQRLEDLPLLAHLVEEHSGTARDREVLARRLVGVA